MKKRLLAALSVVLLTISGCTLDMKQSEESEKIYASFFPIYSLAGMIINDIPEMELKCLVQPQDDCLRLYDLSDWDTAVLAYDADVVIIGGHGLESFESALYTFGYDGPAVITANVYDAMITQGGDINSSEHFTGANPFLYMSLDGARKMLAVIAADLARLYPEMSEEITANYNAADVKLEHAAKGVADMCAGIEGESVIIMNEALIYTALDCGLNIAGVYERESGTTLYGQSLLDAIKMFDRMGTKVILIEKQAPAELKKSLAEAGYSIVCIDTMSSYTSDSSYERYIEILLNNASEIVKAFVE